MKALALLVAVSAACASASVKPAPYRIRDPLAPVSCTPDEGAANADAALGTLLGASAVVGGYAVALGQCKNSIVEGSGCTSVAPYVGLGLGAVVAIAFYGSAAQARRESARCRLLQAQQAACASGSLESCRTLTPGWTPPPGYGGIQPATRAP